MNDLIKYLIAADAEMYKTILQKAPSTYTVIVYDSFSHWGKPIPELEETFPTFWEAELYGEYITSVKPDYYIHIERC